VAAIGIGWWLWSGSEEPTSTRPTSTKPALDTPVVRPEPQHSDAERQPQPPRPPQVAPPHLVTLRDATRARTREAIKPCLAPLPAEAPIRLRYKVEQFKGSTHIVELTPLGDIDPTALACIDHALEDLRWPFDAPDLVFALKEEGTAGELR
jgi:hypothetical protein